MVQGRLPSRQPIDDPRRRKPDISRALELLEWQPSVDLHEGLEATIGWFEDDYLGIDQGPIVLMAENHRSGLIWRLMKQDPYVVRGLCRAGFTGGWIGAQCR